MEELKELLEERYTMGHEREQSDSGSRESYLPGLKTKALNAVGVCDGYKIPGFLSC